MRFRTSTAAIVIIGIIVIAGFVWLYTNDSGTAVPRKLDSFAKCLKDKDTIFYGAFWCPHCQKQKAMFGNSVKYLPYVECSTPDAKSQLPVCNEKKIENYPTWIFTDGSRLTGEVPLATLAEKTSCTLP